MIPDLELELLQTTIHEADVLSQRRHPEWGYEELVQGLRRAQQAIQAGEPWAADAARMWRHALRSYCQWCQKCNDTHCSGPLEADSMHPCQLAWAHSARANGGSRFESLPIVQAAVG